MRTVPNDRIRGVEVETPPLHRLFGLVRVRIDAAAGAMPARTRSWSSTASRAPRATGCAPPSSPTGRPRPRWTTDGATPEPAEEEFGRFDNRWLLYAPLVGSYLALPLAAVGALFRLAQELPENLRPESGRPGPGRAAAAARDRRRRSRLLLLLVGSVIGAAVVNWGFRLVRRGGSLIAVRGLITRRHTELEIDRIRGATIAEGAGMRLVRAARVNALVTGLGDAARRGQLLPLGPRVGGLVAGPTGSSRTRVRSSRIPPRPAAGGSCGPSSRAWSSPRPGVVATVARRLVVAAGRRRWCCSLLGVPLGLGRYAALGHVAGPRSFSVRSGWLVREQAILQRRAVVGWQVRQSFFQRRHGLATVMACVGAGRGGYAALDMAADDVAGFAAAASGRWAAEFSIVTRPET